MIEKTFINNQLGIKFNSYIDSKLKFGSKQNKSLKYLDIKNQMTLLKDI